MASSSSSTTPVPLCLPPFIPKSFSSVEDYTAAILKFLKENDMAVKLQQLVAVKFCEDRHWETVLPPEWQTALDDDCTFEEAMGIPTGFFKVFFFFLI